MEEQKTLFLQIRPMTKTDIPAVAALEAEIFSDAWSERLYEETLDSGRYDCQVLEIFSRGEDGATVPAGSPGGEEDTIGQLAGYFCGQIILDEAEVHRIAVQPGLRGRGYGQVLLADFLDRARQNGVMTVLLEVRAGNAPAIGLYQKNGFVSIGLRKGYYQKPKEDAQILQKCF